MLHILPEVIEPETWTLAFHRTSPYFWVRLLACGKYKHVSAFAWVPALGLWVVYDVTLSGTRLCLLPDSDAAHRRIGDMTADADLMQMRRSSSTKGVSWSSIAPFYCVPAIKHLIGLRGGALLPTGLFRSCLQSGGSLVGEMHNGKHEIHVAGRTQNTAYLRS